jgi:hypothetical protein
MRRSVREASERLQSILEDFTSGQIRSAIRALEKRGADVSAIEGLLPGPTVDRRVPEGRAQKNAVLVQSKAVIALQDSEPGKFAVLDEFERLLRERRLYSETSSLRYLCASLDKTFPRLKNRRDMISRLMSLLAPRSLEDIESFVTGAIPAGQRADDEFKRLADYIIGGR